MVPASCHADPEAKECSSWNLFGFSSLEVSEHTTAPSEEGCIVVPKNGVKECNEKGCEWYRKPGWPHRALCHAPRDAVKTEPTAEAEEIIKKEEEKAAEEPEVCSPSEEECAKVSTNDPQGCADKGCAWFRATDGTRKLCHADPEAKECSP